MGAPRKAYIILWCSCRVKVWSAAIVVIEGGKYHRNCEYYNCCYDNYMSTIIVGHTFKVNT